MSGSGMLLLMLMRRFLNFGAIAAASRAQRLAITECPASIQVGDLVRLQGRGPLMRVVSLSESTAWCVWFNRMGWLQRGVILLTELTLTG